MALSQAALTTLARVKTALGISGSTEDSALETIIEGASAAAVNWCGRTFHREDDIEEKLPGYSSMFLSVSRCPIVSVSSIEYDGAELDSSGYEIHDAGAGMIYGLSGWVWTNAWANAPIGDVPLPGTERKLYTVTYNGGYVTPNQVALSTFSTRTLPYDLEDAIVDMVVDKYRSLGRDSSITSEKVLTGAVTYGGAQAVAVGHRAASVLAKYMRAVIA
jgi:hypothetical protein